MPLSPGGDMAILVCNSLGLGEIAQARLLYQGQGSIRIVTPEGQGDLHRPLCRDRVRPARRPDPGDTTTTRTTTRSRKSPLRSEDCRIITQDEALADGVHRTFDLGYATVQAVEAGYNDNHDVTECVGYVISLSDGVSVYVSGDTSTTEQMPEMASWGIDYAFFCCDGAFNMDTAEASQCAALVGAAHSIPYHTKASPADPAFDLEKAMEFQAEGRLLVNMGQEIVLVRGRCGSRRDADREHLPGVGRKHPVLLALYAGKRSPWDANAPLSPRRDRTGHRFGAGDGRRLP